MLPKLKYLIGTGFTSGRLIPKGPGTEGSLVALVLGSFFWYHLGPVSITVLFVASVVAGFWSAPWFIQTHGEDPGSFVMDEWAGQLLSMHIVWVLPVETSLQTTIILFAATFILFRFFDILKPIGIKRLEAIPGAIGIMADDLLAGFYTFLTLFFVILAVL